MRTDDFFDLIHRFNDGVADLLAFVTGERGQQAVSLGRARADADRKVIGPPIVQEALAGDFHPPILQGPRTECGEGPRFLRGSYCGAKASNTLPFVPPMPR